MGDMDNYRWVFAFDGVTGAKAGYVICEKSQVGYHKWRYETMGCVAVVMDAEEATEFARKEIEYGID